MDSIGFTWIEPQSSLKEAIQSTLGSSGQLIKKFYSSKELSRALRAKETVLLPIELVNNMQINPIYIGPEIRIISETEDYITVHKPAGIHCHPHNYSDQNTVLNFLVSANKWDSVLVNASAYDRGLLYRLDFETSGVLVLAKTDKALAHIRGEFSTSMKNKFYWAIVQGDFSRDGSWTHYFKGSGQKGQKQKVSDTSLPDSIEGSLKVKKVASDGNLSLVLVNLKTGLRHQIRAQLSHLGFPILGDELYGGEKHERLFLHALRYEFVETVEASDPDLFHLFFNLNSALQVTHNVLRIL